MTPIKPASEVTWSELIAEQKRHKQRFSDGSIIDDRHQQTMFPGIPLNLSRGKQRDRGPTLWEQT